MPNINNVAIVIAVSEYGSNGLSDLPSCLRDGQAIEKIVRSTGRFIDENILTISGRVSSNILKSKLSDFMSSKSETTTNELLVYFSGHGEYNADEFFAFFLITARNRSGRRP
jgi:hypothetical protein